MNSRFFMRETKDIYGGGKQFAFTHSILNNFEANNIPFFTKKRKSLRRKVI